MASPLTSASGSAVFVCATTRSGIPSVVTNASVRKIARHCSSSTMTASSWRRPASDNRNRVQHALLARRRSHPGRRPEEARRFAPPPGNADRTHDLLWDALTVTRRRRRRTGVADAFRVALIFPALGGVGDELDLLRVDRARLLNVTAQGARRAGQNLVASAEVRRRQVRVHLDWRQVEEGARVCGGTASGTGRHRARGVKRSRGHTVMLLVSLSRRAFVVFVLHAVRICSPGSKACRPKGELLITGYPDRVEGAAAESNTVRTRRSHRDLASLEVLALT